jgi:long-chain fatty acid transport protein
VLALKLAPWLSLGGGVEVNYAKFNLEQGLRATQGRLADNFRFTGSGWSVGYNLGLLCQPLKEVSLGVAFRSTSPVTLEGETEVERLPAIPTTTQSAYADYTFPLTTVAGLSYRPTPKWNLEFDADYTDWSSFGETVIHQSQAPFGIPQDIHLTMDWQPSWMFEFGVTRFFDRGWHVSAGYVYNENSVPDANYTPLAADLDRHFVSLGVGRKCKRFDFDVTYQFGYGPPHTVSGSTPSTAGQIAGQTADGTYEFISSAVLLTVGMRF